MISNLSIAPVSLRIRCSLVTGGMGRLRETLESFSNQRGVMDVLEITIVLIHQAQKQPQHSFILVAEKVGSKSLPFYIHITLLLDRTASGSGDNRGPMLCTLYLSILLYLLTSPILQIY